MTSHWCVSGRDDSAKKHHVYYFLFFCCYRKDTEVLYLFYMLTCITLLSGMFISLTLLFANQSCIFATLKDSGTPCKRPSSNVCTGAEILTCMLKTLQKLVQKSAHMCIKLHRNLHFLFILPNYVEICLGCMKNTCTPIKFWQSRVPTRA